MNITKVKKICRAGLCVALSALILASPMVVNAQQDKILPSGITVSEAEKVLEQIIYSEFHENTIPVTGGSVREGFF